MDITSEKKQRTCLHRFPGREGGLGGLRQKNWYRLGEFVFAGLRDVNSAFRDNLLPALEFALIPTKLGCTVSRREPRF